ncbi:MAG: hypothetical protein JNM84_13345 [Planctomycetes bacterium]|nr:hypothetical protein [Planctomycetota bacterium]
MSALLLASAIASSSSSSAQIDLADGEAHLRWAAGRPMVRATLRAGEKIYICHLLVDLAEVGTLVLHRNAASVLQSASCRVEIGNAVFEDLPFTARRDTWMEEFTRDHAEELQEVPVAGALGLAAFADRRLRLDGPKARLRLLPARSSSEELSESAGLHVVELLGDPAQSGLRFELELDGSRRERFGLHTRESFSWIDAELARELGRGDGVLRRARAGTLDFAARTPFRPIERAARKGSLGAGVLRGLVLELEPSARRAVFEAGTKFDYPEEEAAFYRARYGAGTLDALRQIATKQPPGAYAAEAAAAWLERLGESDLDATARAAATEAAGRAAIAAAPRKAQSKKALDLIEALPNESEYAAVRATLAETGLASARDAEDGTAAFELRLVLGRLALQRDDRATAKKHLLAAVFGVPTKGAAHLALAELHGRSGEWEMARARAFLAMLDARETGPAGYLSFLRAHRALLGPEADPLPALEELADGRTPYFEALPREAGTVAKTGKTALLELFTGAMCPPCVAADLAVDAASKHYDADELVVLQWHLPIPAPDPLFSPAAAERGGARGVRATPTAFLDGEKARVPGGKVGDAAESFRALREQLQTKLAEAPSAALELRAERSGDEAAIEVACSGRTGPLPEGLRLHAVLVEELVVFPGANGILFHHQVARASFTPPRGIAATDASAAHPWKTTLVLSEVEDALEQHLVPFEEREPFLVRPTDLARERLRVVAFVEEAASGRVLQAIQVPLRSSGTERGR